LCLKGGNFTDLNLGQVIRENGSEMRDTVTENKAGQTVLITKEHGKTTR
jgi:hypothetical protein